MAIEDGEPSGSNDTIKPNSPYYIGPHDKPVDKLTNVSFKLNNYDEWLFAIEHAPKARRKMGFLDGTYTEPKPPCTKEDWDVIESMLMSWVLDTIDPEVRRVLPKYKTVKKLWDELKKKFSQADGPRIQQLLCDLHDYKHTFTMTLVVYN